MKFAALVEYLQDAETVERLRPVHRQYLALLKEKRPRAYEELRS